MIMGSVITWCCVLTSTATVILKHPVDVEAAPNEWVQFNCTITHCDNQHFRWYVAGRPGPIMNNNSVSGLVIRRISKVCTSSNQAIHFFEVQATEALDKSAFYCGVSEVSENSRHSPSSCRCAGRRCYSRPAILIGKPD